MFYLSHEFLGGNWAVNLSIFISFLFVIIFKGNSQNIELTLGETIKMLQYVESGMTHKSAHKKAKEK
jgi:hypothetical protein